MRLCDIRPKDWRENTICAVCNKPVQAMFIAREPWGAVTFSMECHGQIEQLQLSERFLFQTNVIALNLRAFAGAVKELKE